MWGTQYTWNLRIDSAEAHRCLVRALKAQSRNVRRAAAHTGPGPDDGAISGRVGPGEFCLNFMPLRSPNDITASRQGSESELDPVVRLTEISTNIPMVDKWLGGETALVGRIVAVGSGCSVRAAIRPRLDIYVLLALFLAFGLFLPVSLLVGATWVAAALTASLALGLAYWITAVLSSGLRSGAGILRFMDRVWSAVLVK